MYTIKGCLSCYYSEWERWVEDYYSLLNQKHQGLRFLKVKFQVNLPCSADGDCSHEIKRRSLLGRKVMTNLDSILKSRDITLPAKVRLVNAMVFPVVMYRCESWMVKKAECQKIDAFELGVGEDSWESLGLQGDPTSPSWRRSALGVHWKDWRWSWNSNTLATSCEELTHQKRPWCWEGLGAGGGGDDRGWDGSMASPTRWTWVWVNSRSWWWIGRPGMLRFMGLQRVRHDWVTELNWTALILLAEAENMEWWWLHGKAASTS